MILDNSAASAFRECPFKYFETYLAQGTGLEPKPKLGEVTPLDLGSRIHELLEEYYQELKDTPIPPYPESPNAALEMEAQLIMSAYRAKYPVENFEIVDVERTFKVALPELCPHCYSKNTELGVGGEIFAACLDCACHFNQRRHIYTGKIDITFRDEPKLSIMDHKSERRRSNSNHPKKWAARDQASLYLWAASKIYPREEIGNFYVNVLKRPSDKMQEGPIFPDRQRLERTPEQIEIAVRDLVFIADEIERYKAIFKDGLWPANREECSSGYGECSFYLPHTFGWSEAILQEKFQVKKEYLKLGGVPIIQ